MSANIVDPALLSAKSVSDISYLQKFAVNFEFPVVFTEDLFNPANATLRDTVCRLEPDKRHRCLFFVDQGLLDRAWPSALRRTRSRCSRRTVILVQELF